MPTRQQRLDHAQTDQVGVAAVRRGGMGVVAHRQAKVADGLAVRWLNHVFARTHQLDDDQRQVWKAQRIGLALARQKTLQRARIGRLGQGLAVFFGHLDDAQPALGRAHHPAQGTGAVLRQKLRRAGVGGNHELFDQLARTVLLLLADTDHALALEHGARLEGLQIQRALLAPARAHTLRHGVLRAQLLVHAGHGACGSGQVALALNPRRHGVVGQLGLVAHARAVYGAMADGAIHADHHLGDDGEALLTRVERGEVGREALGQHGKHPRRGVDRSGIDVRVQVNGRVLFDQRIHIGHGDKNFHRSVAHITASGQLVQVERVVVVDGAPRQRRQVADVRALFVRRSANALQLLQGTGRELWLQAAIAHGLDGNARQIAAMQGGGSVLCVHDSMSPCCQCLRAAATGRKKSPWLPPTRYQPNQPSAPPGPSNGFCVLQAASTLAAATSRCV